MGDHRVAAKQTRLSGVEAAGEREAMEKAAKEFQPHTTKLIAVRRPQQSLRFGSSRLPVKRTQLVPGDLHSLKSRASITSAFSIERVCRAGSSLLPNFSSACHVYPV
jgi:hypothetical protein